MSQPIIVGPYTVDATKCSHTTDGEHQCIHDWRITWGNVERTGDE
ncbi:hypothetical protein [Mycobacterium paragordonae]|uniref:Uncharacterized protein n=1 Tax=Mycobacterium paragordonae TaxID=1389713 RepID=A0AAJ1S2H8_9MYCO|nr:hypothetical protein [Mycobacterium paragordonae]MDP7733644.1 hypothetical protein [Mycobacterium paragordonae]